MKFPFFFFVPQTVPWKHYPQCKKCPQSVSSNIWEGSLKNTFEFSILFFSYHKQYSENIIPMQKMSLKCFILRSWKGGKIKAWEGFIGNTCESSILLFHTMNCTLKILGPIWTFKFHKCKIWHCKIWLKNISNLLFKSYWEGSI